MKPHVGIMHYAAPPVLGGVESIIRHHVRLLRSAGFPVIVVAGRGTAASTGTVTMRVPTMRVTHPGQMLIEQELARGCVSSAFFELRDALIADLEPVLARCDVIIVHNAFTFHFNLPLTAALCQMAGGALEGRFVAWTHDIAAVNPLYAAELHPGYPWSLVSQPQPGVHYVCISEERRAQLRQVWEGGTLDSSSSSGRKAEATERAISMIPNGVDAQTYLRLSQPAVTLCERLGLFDRDMVLLLPVRITRRKNIELAIGVTSALRARAVDVMFLVTGPAATHHPGRSRSYLDELKAAVQSRELQSNFIFLADYMGRHVSSRLLADLFAVSDALFLPSHSEGFGLPVIEAAIARVPAVLSDLQVFRELAGDGASYFDLDMPPDRIAEKVWDLTMSGQGRLFRRALRDYRWEAVFTHYIAPLIEQVAAGAEL